MVLTPEVIGASAAAVGVSWGVWKWLATRFDKKADKHAVANQFHDVKTEQTLQRTYFKDVFEKLESHERRDEDRTREILQTMSSNHAEVLRELGRKADR